MAMRRFDLFKGIKEKLFSNYRTSLEKSLRPLGLVRISARASPYALRVGLILPGALRFATPPVILVIFPDIRTLSVSLMSQRPHCGVPSPPFPPAMPFPPRRVHPSAPGCPPTVLTHEIHPNLSL